MNFHLGRKISILAAVLALIGALMALPMGAGAFDDPQRCESILPLPAPRNAAKFTLCHATGSTSNPFIVNEVSRSGMESHILNPDHHGDCAFGPHTSATNTLVCVQ